MMNNPFDYIASLDYKSLEAYLKVSNINILNDKGRNLLIASIIAEFDDAFDLLIKNYININQTDNLGNTPLMYTIMFNRIGYFKRLIREKCNLNITNLKGESPIMLALNLKKMDMAYILLDMNVDLTKSNQNDENITFSIVRSHNLSLLKKIIEKDKRLIYSQNYTHRTLLHEACMVKDKEIALYLLASGVLSNCADNFGETPMFFAVREKDYDMIALLLSYGARLEKMNGFYETVFDIAKDELLEFLKYQQLSIKYNRYQKKYPLHTAVLLNDFLKVKQTLSRYNIGQKDDFKYRPIEYAKLLNYKHIYNLLLQFEKQL